tara:strand:+ start:14209 stop:15315 length:1107 start_codon:yes stop_codon:yes gene_type:complete
MKKFNFIKAVLISSVVIFSSCGTDNDVVECSVSSPDNYVFSHDGTNTVSFGGQTARLKMVGEILDKLEDETATDVALLNEMFANGTGFADATLDASGKQVRSKTAGYQTATVKANVQAMFDSWLVDYTSNVAPAMAAGTQAAPGVPGWVDNRELNAKGQELDQFFAKGLIGALCLDQVANGYLSEAKIGDGVDNVTRDPYTDMEHHWDEGYGYIYGIQGAEGITSEEISGDNLLGKYLTKYEDHRATVYNAFIEGRQAIVENCSEVRDEQAQIIKETLSKVVAIRAAYYLEDAALQTDLSAAYFHSLSEGYGFIMSLQFTVDANGNPYYTHDEVNIMLDQLNAGNGFWDRTDAELNQMAADIKAVCGL